MTTANLVAVLLTAAAAASAQPSACPQTGDAAALRAGAAALYFTGDHAAADACISAALVAITNDLELLAAQADALRRFRDARRAAPASLPALGSGCIVNADGSSVCLPELSKMSATAQQQMPQSVEECGSEQTALALLQQQQQQQQQPASDVPAAVADADASAGGSFYDSFIVTAANRLWWTAAKYAVEELRKQNVPPSSEARSAVTQLRDEAGSLLALMRQTKMDEATIHCAVMWAQGESSVHLNVKFAGRLDAPVTVLNVDNEVVHINSTHVSFSGIGRQKPKRYVVDISLYGAIDPEHSSWAFGSVGTVRFILRKNVSGAWPRLSSSNETIFKHRVWWEKQEQVAVSDRKAREAEDRQQREAKAEEERKLREADMAEKVGEAHAYLRTPPTHTIPTYHTYTYMAQKVAEAAALRAKQTAERTAKRLEQMPALDAALLALDAFAAAPKEELDDRMASTLEASKEVLKVSGQEGNETAIANAEQMLNALRKLHSTGFAELTVEASTDLVTKYKRWLVELIEPEPEPETPAPSTKKAKKKGKKKSGKAAAKPTA